MWWKHQISVHSWLYAGARCWCKRGLSADQAALISSAAKKVELLFRTAGIWASWWGVQLSALIMDINNWLFLLLPFLFLFFFTCNALTGWPQCFLTVFFPSLCFFWLSLPGQMHLVTWSLESLHFHNEFMQSSQGIY